MSRTTNEGPFPEADRFQPSHNDPLFELAAVARALEDLGPAPTTADGRREALMWSAAAAFSLICFLLWLLVSH
jgi:hypothetical protein